MGFQAVESASKVSFVKAVFFDIHTSDSTFVSAFCSLHQPHNVVLSFV